MEDKEEKAFESSLFTQEIEILGVPFFITPSRREFPYGNSVQEFIIIVNMPIIYYNCKKVKEYFCYVFNILLGQKHLLSLKQPVLPYVSWRQLSVLLYFLIFISFSVEDERKYLIHKNMSVQIFYVFLCKA